MAEKILNTRIALRYDTYENLYASTFILKAGEAAIATVANTTSNATSTGTTGLPHILVKIGDGVNLYKDLPFISAMAADVHGWAKEASKPTYSYTEITGLEQYIRDTANNEIKNTDTQYNLVAVDAANYKYELRSKGLEDAAWTKVADLDLSGIVSEIAALKNLVGTEKVSDQIATAIGNIVAAGETAGQGEIISAVSQNGGFVEVTKRALVKEDIPVIEKTQVDGLDTALENATKAGTDAAAKALEDANDYTDEKIGAIGYVDPTYAEGQFVTKVTQQNGMIEVERAAVGIANVTGLSTKLGEIDGALSDLEDTKQDKLTFVGDSGLIVTPGTAEGKRVVTEEFVISKLADLTGAMIFVGRLDDVPTDNAQYEAGNVILVGDVEYVFDGTTWLELGNESIYQPKSEAVEQHNALQKAIEDGLAELDEAKQDNVNFKSAYSAANPVMTEDDVDAAISGAFNAVNVAGETAGKGEIIETVKQEHGALVVTKRALKAEDIPMIQQNQVDGLEQALEDVEAAGEAAAAQALADAKADAASQIQTAVTGLAKADTAVEKNVVTAVSQEQGVINVTRAPLSDIAWSGNVKDLKQDEGDVLVFYCGTATEVI